MWNFSCSVSNGPLGLLLCFTVELCDGWREWLLENPIFEFHCVFRWYLKSIQLIIFAKYHKQFNFLGDVLPFLKFCTCTSKMCRRVLTSQHPQVPKSPRPQVPESPSPRVPMSPCPHVPCPRVPVPLFDTAWFSQGKLCSYANGFGVAGIFPVDFVSCTLLHAKPRFMHWNVTGNADSVSMTMFPWSNLTPLLFHTTTHKVSKQFTRNSRSLL